MMSSLKMNLIASASGWRRPSGPTRSGPMRPCIHALRRRSTITIPGVRDRTMNPMTKAILAAMAIGLHTQGTDLAVRELRQRLAEDAFRRDDGGPGLEGDEDLLEPLGFGARRHGRLDRLADPLHPAVDVHEGAVLLRPGRP